MRSKTVTFERVSDTQVGSLSPPRISRRAALAASGVGLVGVIASQDSPLTATAMQATPVAGTAQALPTELQLALTDIVLSVMGEANVPGAIVSVSIPDQGTWSIATGLGDITNAT